MGFTSYFRAPRGRLGRATTPNDEPPSAAKQGDSAEAVGWPLMSVLVLGSLMGVGILSLPNSYQTLGWLPAAASVYSFATIACYAGSLYGRLMAALPGVSTWHDLGHRALGRWGVVLVWVTAYAALFAVPPVLHITAANALQQMVGEEQLSLFMSTFYITAIMLPLAQLHKLSKVGWLGAFGSSVMGVAVVLLVVKLGLIDPPAPEGDAVTHLVEHPPLMPAVVGVMNILFAFSGQENWVRFIAGMGPHRVKFSYSTAAAYTVLTPMAVCVGAIGYWRHGGSLDPSLPITSQLVPDTWAALINAGVFLAIVVSYTIHINVVTQVFLELVAPRRFKAQHGNTPSIDQDSEPARSSRYPKGEASEPLLSPEERQGFSIPPAGSEPGDHVEVTMTPSGAGTSGPQADRVRLQLHTAANPGAPAPPPSAPPPPEPPSDASPAVEALPEGGPSSHALSSADLSGLRTVSGLRTMSEAEQALGTGIVLPSMAEELEGGETRDPEMGYSNTTRVKSTAAKKTPGPPQPQLQAAKANTPRNINANAQNSAPAPAPAAQASGPAAREGGGAGGSAGTGRSAGPSRGTDAGGKDDSHRRAVNRSLWGLSSATIIVLAWLVSYTWPSFSELISIVSAFGCVSSMMLLPALFGVLLLPLSHAEFVLCSLLCVVSVVLSVLGVVAGVHELYATGN